ncbi:RrF2 family transcriptional regulator [Celeribacter litoreus]|uniref:RrF2 family transcriptional regulator n=1 Tax=Celeribacter litoreus TaxID=2876714 RepID=UPI001CCA85E9|nr:Rrf2 family transcriptional regulator [Celeribacter litoreus]MCA0043305.1 Rrf2 family transcriptional regulator [Celeribacter litoreus]
MYLGGNSVHLSKFSDYAIRVCLHLTAHTGKRVSIAEIAKLQGLSHANLMKVVNQLVDAGFLKSTRGRSGGVELAQPADHIRIGEVVRHMEGEGALVDCRTCVIRGSCGLPSVLQTAKRVFFEHLDQFTLADAIAAHPRTRDVLLGLSLESSV